MKVVAFSGRQRTTKYGTIRPIEGSFRLTKDALRPTQGLSSNMTPKADIVISQANA